MTDPKVICCVACKDTALVRADRHVTRTVSDIQFSTQVSALVCPSCSNTYHPADTLENFERSIARWLANAGVCSGDAFHFMRQTLGVSAVDFANLIGMSLRVVMQWEAHATVMNSRAMTLMALMVKDHHEHAARTLDTLRNQQAFTLPSSTVFL